MVPLAKLVAVLSACTKVARVEMQQARAGAGRGDGADGSGRMPSRIAMTGVEQSRQRAPRSRCRQAYQASITSRGPRMSPVSAKASKAGARTALICALAGSKLSSKSRACAAVPLTSAAHGAATGRSDVLVRARANHRRRAVSPVGASGPNRHRGRIAAAGNPAADDVDECLLRPQAGRARERIRGCRPGRERRCGVAEIHMRIKHVRLSRDDDNGSSAELPEMPLHSPRFLHIRARSAAGSPTALWRGCSATPACC